MKKTITRKDGTVEVLEGTPAEFVEYDQLVSKQTAVDQGEKKVDDTVKRLYKQLERTPTRIKPWWDRPLSGPYPGYEHGD